MKEKIKNQTEENKSTKKKAGENNRRVKININKKSNFEKFFKDSALILSKGNIFRLNQTGALIWKFIDKIPINKIISLISQEKNIPRCKVEDMIHRFIDELKKNDLIELN